MLTLKLVLSNFFGFSDENVNLKVRCSARLSAIHSARKFEDLVQQDTYDDLLLTGTLE